MDKQELSITTGSWIKGVIVIALAYALYQLAGFVLVLLVSIIIASAIEPLTKWGKRQGVPRVPMVVGTYFIGAILLAGFFYFLLLPLIGEVTGFLRTLAIYSNSINEGSVLSAMFENQRVFGNLDTPAIIAELNSYLNKFAEFLSRGVFSTASSIFGGVVSLVIMLVLSFYLAVQEDGVARFLKLVVPVKREKYIIDLWHRSQKKIGYWMQGQLILAVLVGVMVYVGLLIIGVPHALLLAVIAGAFELIPLFGATLAAIPALFVAFTYGGMTTALIVLALYVIIQQLESHVIAPQVVSKVVGVPAVVSILALVVGAELAGFLGVLISVPVASVIMELLNDLGEHKAAANSHNHEV